jgi:hypothetical protein
MMRQVAERLMGEPGRIVRVETVDGVRRIVWEPARPAESESGEVW